MTSFPLNPAKRPAECDAIYPPAAKRQYKSWGGEEHVHVPLQFSSSSTHVIFCVDISGSMRAKDVRQNGQEITTRISAVFRSCHSFIADQLRQPGTCADRYSLILFNDRATIALRQKPLNPLLLTTIDELERSTTPGGGTEFGVAFEAVQKLSVKSKATERLMLIFLSDGRPGDCGNHACKIKDVVKSHGKSYVHPVLILQSLREIFRDKFVFSSIGIHKDGYPWLKKLAQEAGGVFTPVDRNAAPAVHARHPAGREDSDDDCVLVEDSDDDCVLVEEVPFDEKLRREHLRALDEGRHVDLAKTQGSYSLMGTFLTLSSSLTATRTEGRTPKCERQVKLESATAWERSTSEEVQFRAITMIWKPSGKLVPDKRNPRQVSLRRNPFKQGAMRNVYHLFDDTTTPHQHLVAKDSRYRETYKDRLAYHLFGISCQNHARLVASRFNSCLQDKMQNISSATLAALSDSEGKLLLSSLKRLPGCVRFLACSVFRLEDENSPGGMRYLSTERYVDEQFEGSFEKFNNNNGHTHPLVGTGEAKYDLPQAFSHFSFVDSQGQTMICDIQGWGTTYTDPQVLTRDKKFGPADLGSTGMDKFFSTHRCGHFCKLLGLPKNDKFVSQ
ncbi:hypothetical protein CYMTET_42375 [Cymbomonas tetramitiformis]|uniref:Alpha-type protein kinase domain-containing protein n=1 Tax=Cymbomonas tetramitiformis TaxID=36881 RepID=A0AAE0F1B3_9CHLO|nr:hypothetical protein CYMTET_42375 [Cymbomonas tetramitiformis]